MKKIHFIGIGGSAMGSVAVATAKAGYTVTGSDHGIYPPMSTVLEDAGIQWSNGYDAAALLKYEPDLIVVGNAISRGNPELEAVLNHRLPFTSMSAFVGDTLIGRATSIVVTGTHGKTTTTSMASWILDACGRQPGYLIGGVPSGLDGGCRPTMARDSVHAVFVSEGDEYDTAFFDKRSKFVHYRPTVAVINNIEFDHADIFASLSDIKRSFQQLVRIVPSSGRILGNADDVNVLDVVHNAPCPVETVGYAEDATWRIVDESYSGGSSKWYLRHGSATKGPFTVAMAGKHNIRNASMALIAAFAVGIPLHDAQHALERFTPPKRRLEHITTWHGRIVVDDFAHHPTAIAATIRALRLQYPKSNLTVVFEPRSNTSTRNIFFSEFRECFDGASTVLFGPINRPERYDAAERLDTEALAADLQKRGISAQALPTSVSGTPDWGSSVIPLLQGATAPSDVIAILSNGSVGGLREMLIASQPT
ncbi:MAG: Mur ligase family protein [Candidatus Kapabacteria bacterium]|jgi:UDP-N-acetylmuramate: L-alanyl-gamma-D-glutamyl-meso-diaminopimelate ligase|nr:Mur ligase family protein [Candidatus Kapabacteria bacterium]